MYFVTFIKRFIALTIVCSSFINAMNQDVLILGDVVNASVQIKKSHKKGMVCMALRNQVQFCIDSSKAIEAKLNKEMSFNDFGQELDQVGQNRNLCASWVAIKRDSNGHLDAHIRSSFQDGFHLYVFKEGIHWAISSGEMKRVNNPEVVIFSHTPVSDESLSSFYLSKSAKITKGSCFVTSYTDQAQNTNKRPHEKKSSESQGQKAATFTTVARVLKKYLPVGVFSIAVIFWLYLTHKWLVK